MTTRQQRNRSHDAKRRDVPWRHWYWTARWRRRSRDQLTAHPLCNRCSTDHRPVAATVANHVIPHKGNEALFWEGELESVCAPCHDGAIRSEEARGHRIGVTIEGRPKDPKHPWNRSAQ